MTKVFLVPTPIGNLADMTYRAVETLNAADIIYCEDTRHSRVLLNHYGINKQLKSLHKFNEASVLDGLVAEAHDGKTIAVISDAGMPGICDPGERLVERLLIEGISYTVLPGACAFVNAFVLSGFKLPFTFAGFLKEKSADRKKQLDALEKSNTLIFYSAVHNVNDDLRFLAKELGSRKVAVAREISKMFEEVVFFDLPEANLPQPRGEYVIVIDSTEKQDPLAGLTDEQRVAHYEAQGMTRNDAVKQTAKDRGVPKNEIYKKFI